MWTRIPLPDWIQNIVVSNTSGDQYINLEGNKMKGAIRDIKLFHRILDIVDTYAEAHYCEDTSAGLDIDHYEFDGDPLNLAFALTEFVQAYIKEMLQEGSPLNPVVIAKAGSLP